MDKIIYYVLLMILLILLLPLLIVRGCSFKEETPPAKQEPEEGINIRVYIHETDDVVQMPLEEYIKGVVAAEMPAEFEPEALKAQAVAARTYAYGRLKKIYVSKEDKHGGADICTDSLHCQAWVDKNNAMKKWGFFTAAKNWKKIEKAVDETRDLILLYDGKVINPVFHSNSGGKTENAEDVWAGNGVPYLKSVISRGEEDNPAYKSVVYIDIDDFYTILKKEYPEIKLDKKDIPGNIKVHERTEGGRVKTIEAGNVEISGTVFRKLFSLRSANFSIEKGEKGTIKITVIGNGHGVGMSQWGANYLAKCGGSFEEILKYYYQGVQLATIRQFKGAD